MILGISGSPRPNSVTASAVKRVLAESGKETEYISLAGKKISGCISCLGCTSKNMCVVKDDFLEIAKAMLKADAIVFGAPNYFDQPNALSHCLWERCFCFRHNGEFLLKNKLEVIISTGYSNEEKNNPVIETIKMFMNRNKMKVVSKFTVGAYSQCYDCNQGIGCKVGNIVKDHGFVDKLTPEMYPKKFEDQHISILKCDNAAKCLKNMLS
ncbi:flavodoxin family protein [Clostridium sp. cel8]|uniref:flavodoxin family protein n=1 Tax=Clostridium sp. cel8 TaxID=2663123 RepID=UPI0015F6C656|nr:flavodoxin family protein [Clostridium sp. cel8]MBA5850757.1 flavodoxin family protein [Clostridium sp. cel8]